MKNISFTKYFYQNRKRVLSIIDRPNEIAEMADALRDKGFKFTLKILPSKICAMYCGRKCDDEQYMSMCGFEEDASTMIDDLVRKAYQREFPTKE